LTFLIGIGVIHEWLSLANPRQFLLGAGKWLRRGVKTSRTLMQSVLGVIQYKWRLLGVGI
jgi:hypothetical protein